MRAQNCSITGQVDGARRNAAGLGMCAEREAM